MTNQHYLEQIKHIETDSVDCVILDLEYATNSVKWDVAIDIFYLWEELKRISKTKKTPFFFFCGIAQAMTLIQSNKSWFRYDLVLQHTKPLSKPRRKPFKTHTYLLVFYQTPPLYNIKTVKSILEYETVFEWIKNCYTNKTDVILHIHKGVYKLSFNSQTQLKTILDTDPCSFHKKFWN